MNSPHLRSRKIFIPNIFGIKLSKLFGDTKNFVKNTQYLEKNQGAATKKKNIVENLKFFPSFRKRFTVNCYFYCTMTIADKFWNIHKRLMQIWKVLSFFGYHGVKYEKEIKKVVQEKTLFQILCGKLSELSLQ